MKKTVRLVAGLLVLLFASGAAAEMRPVMKLRAGVPPYEVIGEVIRANNARIAGGQKPAELAELATPHLTWLVDVDARLQPDLITASTHNKIVTVRTLANQLVLAADTVDYTVRHLHTPVLLITGSSDSQAIRSFLAGYQELEPAIRTALDHLHLPLADEGPTGARPAPAGKAAPEKQPTARQQLLAAVERNVDFQVEQALGRYQDRVRSGRLVVVGSVLDLTNDYGHGAGRLIVININGERDDAKLRRSRLLLKLEKKLKETSVGRARPMPTEAKEK